MTEAQKNRLEELRAKKAEELTDEEKSVLDLLITIEKQAGQIEEKDSLIGKRATDLDNLKKELEKAKDGKEKEALEARIEEKEEALEIARSGLAALKDAQERTQELADKFQTGSSGDGDDVDPEEVAKLERQAKASEEAKAAVEEAYGKMTDAEKQKFKTDPAFKMKVLRMAIPEGEISDDSPWSTDEEDEGTPHKTEEERLNELFDKKTKQRRTLPPGSGGRIGRPGQGTDLPERTERVPDERTA